MSANAPSAKTIPGSAARLAASNMLALVVDDKASVETLSDPVKGYQAFLKLDNRDKALARAILLTSLRNRNHITAALEACWNRKPPKKARHLLFTLEVAAAQILFMEVPASAAVNLAVNAIRKDRRTTRFAGFANAVLRKLEREKKGHASHDVRPGIFPNWMQKQLTTDYGREKTAAISTALYQEPSIDLQFKSAEAAARTDLDAISTMLTANSRRLSVLQKIDNLPGYKEGEWWVQDIAAAQPANLLGDVEGKRVADLCAAPGGKTMQLAARGAKVTAVDISKTRLKRLEENLTRTGLSADIVAADILDWQPQEKFDAVLLDAPCAASGTIRRHPDILWNSEPGEIETLAQLQHKLIEKAALLLKPGGILVYANCSLFKAEGENLVASLKIDGLERDPIEGKELPGFEHTVTGQHVYRALPHYPIADTAVSSGMDGFFAARFIRSN